MKITLDIIKSYLNEDFDKDAYYEESIEVDKKLSEVFGDEYPDFMSFQRPNETPSQMAYRKLYFENIGNPIKGFQGQLQKQLGKIFSSQEFSLRYSDSSQLKNKKDKIKTYLEENYYNGSSFLASFQEAIERECLFTPNSVLYVMPDRVETGHSDGEIPSEYPTPYFSFARSENVLHFCANTFCVIKSELKNEYLDANGVVEYGDIYYFFDEKHYSVVKYTGLNEKNERTWDISKPADGFHKHGYSSLPCRKVGRKVKQSDEIGHELKDSDVTDSLFHLREAIFRSIDLAIEYNFHVSSQEWAIGFIECGTCRGHGVTRPKDGKGKSEVCGTCNGSKLVGQITGSGLDKMIVPYAVESFGESQKLPSVIGGFIERPETGVKYLSEAVDKSLALALRPFGLEHLINVPYNQSGTSKDRDMSEGHSFIMICSDHVCGLLDFVVNAITSMRYKSMGEDIVLSEIPILTKPTSFNLNTVQSIIDQIRDAEQYNFGDDIKTNLTKELFEKKYGGNSPQLKYYISKAFIDPMPTASFTEKSMARGFLSDYDFILTNRITNILNECILDNNTFLDMDMKDQLALANAKAALYAEEAKENLAGTFVMKPNTNVMKKDHAN